MGIASNLPPALQEVENELLATLKSGGVEACKALVNRLSVESDFGGVIADEAELAQLEIEEDIDTFPEIRKTAKSRSRGLSEMYLAGKIATMRYLYAAKRLQEIQKQLGST